MILRLHRAHMGDQRARLVESGSGNLLTVQPDVRESLYIHARNFTLFLIDSASKPCRNQGSPYAIEVQYVHE